MVTCCSDGCKAKSNVYHVRRTKVEMITMGTMAEITGMDEETVTAVLLKVIDLMYASEDKTDDFKELIESATTNQHAALIGYLIGQQQILQSMQVMQQK